MNVAETIDISESLFARLLTAIVEVFTPRAPPTASEPLERAIRSLSTPLVEATDEDALDRAFSSAVDALPAALQALPRSSANGGAPLSNDAARMLPWLLQRVAGDLDPAALVGEFSALLQLQHHMFARLMAKAPAHVVDRALRLSDDDLKAALRDPVGRHAFASQAALFALVGLHEALGRIDTWRRRRVLMLGLGALRAGVDKLSPERSFAESRWLLRCARELGLWLRRSLDVSRSIEVALQGSPPNRAALLTLRERVGENTPLIYVGDVRATFDQLLSGDVVHAALEDHLAAGEAYEHAEISIDELARRWSLDVPDTLVRLEELGVSRQPRTLRLTDDERRARLSKINADRLARRAGTSNAPDLVRRSVIASQRIEGIDARQHLPGTTPGERTRG